MSWLPALGAILSGTLLTYLYDEDAPLHVRLCAGACVGLTALGLIGFIIASFVGLTPFSLTLSTLVTAAPFALLTQSVWRARVRFDLANALRWLRRALTRPTRQTTWPLVLFTFAAVLFWFIFDRAFFNENGQLFTGVENNLGDLPFHLGIITGFARGANFPPQHPEFAGARLTYPFIVDFIAALFVRGGASLTAALFWENLALALALVVITQWWQALVEGADERAATEPADAAERGRKKGKQRKVDKKQSDTSAPAPSLLTSFPFSLLPRTASSTPLRRMLGAGF